MLTLLCADSKHDSKKDAEAALAGKLVASASSKKKKPRYYAVAVGHQTGVFTSWPDVAPLIKGFKGAKQQGFDTEEEALQFIKNNANHDATKALDEKAGSAKVHVKQEEKEEKVKKEDKEITVEPLPDDECKLNIWTDGASRGNGQLGARAGLGVYFGPSDPRNISERLPGEPQTNQRAELMAIQRALEVVPDAQDILIYSDSQYSIKCLTIWSINWRKNHWKTSTGQDVKNRDIVEEVVRLIQERKGKTDFKWVKGHAMDEGNEAADVLAVKGAMMN